VRPPLPGQDDTQELVLRLRAQAVPSRGPPRRVLARQDRLLYGLNEFLATQVFWAARQYLLDRDLHALDASEEQARADALRSLRTAITETESKSKRLLRNLELVDAPDPDFVRDINERRAQLRVHKQSLMEQMAELEDQVHQAPSPGLLSRLPVTPVDLSALPDDLFRRLFEALRLEIQYDGVADEAAPHHSHRRHDRRGSPCRTRNGGHPTPAGCRRTQYEQQKGEERDDAET
jgi:hypothetical protein